jgi:hypothetical protein
VAVKILPFQKQINQTEKSRLVVYFERQPVGFDKQEERQFYLPANRQIVYLSGQIQGWTGKLPNGLITIIAEKAKA